VIELMQRSQHTHEKIICIWIGPANLEELHQVMKLTMNITADGDWAFLDVLGGRKLEKAGDDIPLAVHLTLLVRSL